jgi:plasmid stabilization system protein ParE
MIQIVYEKQFKEALLDISGFIARDKQSAALDFKKKLKLHIEYLKENPMMYRKSRYFEDEAYRDMTFKGYTIIYKIEDKHIKILDIFKWIDR